MTVEVELPTILITTHEMGRDIKQEINQRLLEAGCLRPVNGEMTPIPTAALPLVFPAKLFNRVKQVAEATLRIGGSALPFLMTHATALRNAGYGALEVALASWEMKRGDNAVPAIARVDMTLDCQSLHVLEINTDSPAGMFHTDVLSEIYAELYEHIGLTDLVDGESKPQICRAFADALILRWRAFCERSNDVDRILGNIAIVEWDPHKALACAEQEYFAQLLAEHSAAAFRCDPSELTFEKNKLRTTKRRLPIDVVYRRALWNTILAKPDHQGAKALLDAYMQGTVHIENGFSAQMVGNKAIMAIVKSPDFNDNVIQGAIRLSDYDQAVIRDNIPGTWFWGGNGELRSRVLARPERYVLKSCGGYGAMEVIVGAICSSPAERFAAMWDKGYVVQERVPHGVIEIPLCENDIRPQRLYFILGAYLVDGKCVAIDAKLKAKIPVTMNIPEFGEGPKAYRTCVYSTTK